MISEKTDRAGTNIITSQQQQNYLGVCTVHIYAHMHVHVALHAGPQADSNTECHPAPTPCRERLVDRHGKNTGAAHPHMAQTHSWLEGWSPNTQSIGLFELSKIKTRGVSWQQCEQNTKPSV